MLSHKDAGEKIHQGQKSPCWLKTRAPVSTQQYFSQRTAASRPTTAAIDPRQYAQPLQYGQCLSPIGLSLPGAPSKISVQYVSHF